MQKLHEISELKFKKNILELKVDGSLFSVDINKISPILAKANDKQRNNFTISPAGYGINWPDLDEDLSIEGLIRKL